MSALAVIVAVAASTSPDVTAIRVDRIDEVDIGTRLPPGWEVLPVRGHSAPRSRVVADAR